MPRVRMYCDDQPMVFEDPSGDAAADMKDINDRVAAGLIELEEARGLALAHFAFQVGRRRRDPAQRRPEDTAEFISAYRDTRALERMEDGTWFVHLGSHCYTMVEVENENVRWLGNPRTRRGGSL